MAYKDRFKIEYRDRDDKLCIIKIQEDGYTGVVEELTPGSEPFTYEIDDDDFLFTPVRYSGATINVVGKDNLMNLFTSELHNYKVRVERENTLIWQGFITPEMYSQDYKGYAFELSIECQSPLSTLKEVHYKAEDITTDYSIAKLIKLCLDKSNGDYTNIYIPDVYTEDFKSFKHLPSNWLDEDGKGENYDFILEAVCNFFNWTCVEDGIDIYFIDYSNLKRGKYLRYERSMSTPYDRTFIDTVGISKDDYMGSDNTLSIRQNFNKAVVVASDYEYEKNDLTPDMGKVLLEDLKFRKDNNIAAARHDKYWWAETQYYKTDKFNLYKYNDDGTLIPEPEDGYSEAIELNNLGSSLTASSWWYNKDMLDVPDKSVGITCKMTKTNNDSSVFPRNGEYKLFSLKKPLTKVLFDKDSALIFNLSMLVGVNYIQDDDDFKFANPEQHEALLEAYKEGAYTINEYFDIRCSANNAKRDGWMDYSMKVQFRIGNLTYRNSPGNRFNYGQWDTGDNYVILQVKDEDRFIDWHQLPQNVTFKSGVDAGGGYVIPLPMDATLGELEITVYNPVIKKSSWSEDDLPRRLNYIYFKDMSCEIVPKKDLLLPDAKKEDTKYEEEVVGEMERSADDITFNLTSKNNSGASKSKVFTDEGIVDTLQFYNGTKVKPEKRMIERIMKNYKNPSTILELELKDKYKPYTIVRENNRYYCPIAKSYDSWLNKARYKLVEINLEDYD